MPNRHRLHVPGGTYYIFRSTDSRHPIFSSAAEYIRFEELLPTALSSSSSKLLAYCWMPESVHLVLEIAEKPIALFMRDLMWRYSRSAWQRTDEDRPWFRERYRATLIQADTYLEAVIRHVHYLPVRAGLAESPDDYPHSSHSAYLGRPYGPPVRTRKLLGMLKCEETDRMPYVHAMAEIPPESFRTLFERGMPHSPGIVSDTLSLLPRTIETVASSPIAKRLETLTARIAERQALDVADLYSKSRRRELVIARAQIVWLAIRWNLGTLTEVAKHLHHSPSAMTRAVSRYKYSRPELFREDIFTPTRTNNSGHLMSWQM